MSRSTALARLATAYGWHLLRRRLGLGRAGSGEAGLLGTYAPDRLLPITSAERQMLPHASACINCGLCAVAVRRIAGLRPAELAAAYLRDYPALGSVAGEVGGTALSPEEETLLREAADACPVGVPLAGVLEMARRLASA